MTLTEKPPIKARPKWDSKIDFVLSCLGFAVGLGNVWRFPYLCGRNGGAAFLIPYFIMMIFVGFPVFYLELAVGQYASMTPRMLYRRMSPIFSGIGYTVVVISTFTAIYYNMIIAWSLYYLGSSFNGIVDELPWVHCRNSWNNNWCYDDKVASTCSNSTPVYYMGQCLNISSASKLFINSTYSAIQFSNDMSVATSGRQTPSQQYNKFQMLNEATSLEGIGWPKLDLVIVLGFAWFFLFICLIKGIKSSGKVVYFTATFPYLVLVTLLIRGNLMDGSEDGVNFFIYPNMSLLSQSGVWVDAAQQILFSLSLGNGGLTTLASYNDFHNNLLRDTFIVVLGNCGTSILAGFTIFPIIGYIAKTVYPNMPPQERVAQFAKTGTTLAFVAYPDALARMPLAWLWCILFFFMLFLLGLDSQFVFCEVLNTAILDNYPRLRSSNRKICVIGIISLLCFLIGFIFTTPIGSYMVTLVDKFAGGMPLLIVCLAEVCMISYVYGYKRFMGNLKEMMNKNPTGLLRLLGSPVGPFWRICWISITPALLIGMLMMQFVDYSRTSQDDYVFPIWADIVGWSLTLSCVIWIPCIAQYKLCKSADLPSLVQSTSDWEKSGQERQAVVNKELDFEMSVHSAVPNKGYVSEAVHGCTVYPVSNSPPAQLYPLENGVHSEQAIFEQF